MHKTGQHYTLLEKSFIFLCISARFWKKLPPAQKLAKNLCHTSRSTTWPPHLQFASYATEKVCTL